ncbi:unnamed protein product [Brassicogethes aeneus]|uniref:Uncharacterized protein n=1 Tax=Brassicogethes aeneus TaxID=1431903 RepID=A0A9P0BB00_BRAAE|nr:unnamed protein product [Brassicogethes aeneus]
MDEEGRKLSGFYWRKRKLEKQERHNKILKCIPKMTTFFTRDENRADNSKNEPKPGPSSDENVYLRQGEFTNASPLPESSESSFLNNVLEKENNNNAEELNIEIAYVEVQEDNSKGKPSYLSKDICNELLNILSNRIIDEIVTQLKANKYYSISVDSTPDVTHNDQLTLILRYCNKKGFPVERFVGFYKNSGHGAQELEETVINMLKSLNLDIKNCRGQSYDNASNMSASATQLQQIYLEDLDEYFPQECVHLKKLITSLSELKIEAPLELVQVLYENKLISSFPNINICLRIFFSIMVSNASGERSFSTLKRDLSKQLSIIEAISFQEEEEEEVSQQQTTFINLLKWEMKRALNTNELLALLEEDSDCENAESVDVVYVPPDTDEITDEENIDENVIGEERLEADIAGTGGKQSSVGGVSQRQNLHMLQPLDLSAYMQLLMGC